MRKRTILTVMMMFMFAMVGSVSAHGGGSGPAGVDPDAKNCMGKLASLHAKDDGGVAHSLHRNHGGLGGPHDTVQSQMKGFKAFCDMEEEEPEFPGGGGL